MYVSFDEKKKKKGKKKIRGQGDRFERIEKHSSKQVVLAPMLISMLMLRKELAWSFESWQSQGSARN